MDPADLMKAMGEIDDDLIEGSERPRGRALLRVLPIAAAFVLVFAAAAALMLFLGATGIMLNIAKQQKREEETEETE